MIEKQCKNAEYEVPEENKMEMAMNKARSVLKTKDIEIDDEELETELMDSFEKYERMWGTPKEEIPMESEPIAEEVLDESVIAGDTISIDTSSFEDQTFQITIRRIL